MEIRQIKEQEFFDRCAGNNGKTWWGNVTSAGVKRLQRRADIVAQKLAHFRNPTVLELGCGTGTFSRFVLEKMPLLYLIGCDISPKSVQIATERYAGYKHANFKVADATSIPYDPGTFDAIIGNSILHHLPIKASMQECFRVLKAGGIVWFSEPNMMNPQVFVERHVRFVGKMLQNTENETAFFRWPLENILREVGFQDICVRPFDFLHPIIPQPLIEIFDIIGRLFERTPFLREISGSLLIYACKPDIGRI